MNVVTKIFRFFLYINGINYLYNLIAKPRLILLGYHSISSEETPYKHLSVSPNNFEKQLLALKKMNYQIVFFRDLLELKNLSQNTAIIYFDDGLSDVYKNTYPLLKKFNFKASIFPVVDFVEKRSTYPQINKDPRDMNIFLSWDELKNMQDVFEVGTHTISHRKLANLRKDEIIEELEQSKNIITKKIGQEVKVLSYPKSSFNSEVQEIAENLDFSFAISNGRGPNYKVERFLKKIPITREDSFIDFKVKIGIWYLIRNLFFK